jgi:hypothetical protein
MALFLVLAAAPALAAQGARPVMVRGVRPLDFGTVLPGVPRVVRRTDPVSSGRLDVSGTRLAPVELVFTLPTQMTGPGGAVMPLTFGGDDAGYSETQAVGNQVGFDPQQPFSAVLNRSGRAAVFLGATANPSVVQRAGAYTATVTLSVAYTTL